MPSDAIPDLHWLKLSQFIAGAMGLHFPRERWPDLYRGLIGAAQEFGFEDVATCSDWLLSSAMTKAQLQVLASHLTVGETYFFRDKQTLRALAEDILPGLIRSRRGRDQRLRIWSAACCSGEEPYTLAILLNQLLPDLADWQVSIRATDINPRFLEKAAAGRYGEWSFRDAPSALKERYFTRGADGRYAVVPEIRELVRFAHLNLVEDTYPSSITDTGAMDLICCRNVLMYFTAAQIANVVGKLDHALARGGWLAVSPSEASHSLFSRFTTVNFPGAILFQKSDATLQTGYRYSPAPLGDITRSAHIATDAPEPCIPPVPQAQPAPALRPATRALDETAIVARHAEARSLYHQGRHAEATDALVVSFAEHAPDPQALSLMTRALANQGKLADALLWCDRWVHTDKVDPAAHYWRAVVLLEHGDPVQAGYSLQRALFLDPHFVVAHFALGNLARSRGRNAEANKHFSNALQALRRHQPNDLLPESDGISAGALTDVITFMTASDNTP